MLLFKNSFSKIRRSLGRFFSLIFIVALGSAFFSGIRETSSDMVKTMDKYYDESSLMDFKIVSTMGLTAADVSSLESLDHSYKVIPSYSYETLIDGKTTKIYALSDQINKIELILCFVSKKYKQPKSLFQAANLYNLKCELKPIQGLPLTRHPSGRSCN